MTPHDPAASASPPSSRLRVRLHPHGLDLGDEIVPLRVGAMHYWRHPPEDWGPGLDAIRALGFRLVDTYVPWGVHEISPGRIDFGEKDPRLDVARFLRMAHERALKVVLRPGPHINAELTNFGLPERIVWDRACQARTSRGNPVMLPIVPVAFPVPSYASNAFHEETALWFERVGRVVRDLRHPQGPIVLVQIDNEGALYFRDGPYDQDYHPDAILLFRSFLKNKYRHVNELRDAWGDRDLLHATANPPTRFDARTADDLPRHMDWMEFHEHLLVQAMERMVDAARGTGLDELPTMHNFPLGEAATPLNAGRMDDVIDLIALDYYHRATPIEHSIIARRTTELAARCEGRMPAFGAEVGAGFPPFFAPIDEKDSLYTLLAALAYGLRGYNLYMAVERDRWIGAPVDPHGRHRPLAAKYERLNAALDATEFHTLRRRAPVRLVVPRVLRRLARATHAFGPISPAAFNILGAGFRESCLEEDLGLGEVATLVGESYLRAFEKALQARGVPFAYAGGDSFVESIEDAKWVICATVGGVKPEFMARLRDAADSGLKVTVGPRVPERDGAMRKLPVPHDVSGLEVEPLEDGSRADELVARRIEELALPTFPVDPDDVKMTVHEDTTGTPRVLFVMNPTDRDRVARVSVRGARSLVDILAPSLSDARVARGIGGFEVTVPARTVRMFAVELSTAPSVPSSPALPQA
ncbi:MAG TPA: beta-galactosidase [Polyangiaceae bacterium]|jgi:beta-galactosidase